MRFFFPRWMRPLWSLVCIGFLYCSASERLHPGPGATLRTPPPEERAEVSPWRLPAEFRFAHTPEWFRRCPALYIPVPYSAGAVMLSFTDIHSPVLPELIASFREMPELLQEARSLGTNTLYFIDFYQGLRGPEEDSGWWQGYAERPPYLGQEYDLWIRHAWWNKGDYVPRTDLGGPEAFEEGIAAVHRAGGRVIVYVEGFIVSEQSDVGRMHGEDWALRTAEGLQGPEAEPYFGNYKMCPACPGWVNHLVTVCRRLVGEYGVDGIHIDSFGAQVGGYECVNPDHDHPAGESDVFHRGRVELLRSVRQAIQEENPEAVVMIELPTMVSLFQEADASQDWGYGAVRNRPLWNRSGQTDLFAAGWSLDEIHQILAVGHKLSLGRFWTEAPRETSCRARVGFEVSHYWEGSPRERSRKLAILKAASMGLFQWYNAGLLLGRPLPDLTELNRSIHRWLPSRFQSDEKLETLFREIEESASEVDRAIPDADRIGLPPPSGHIRDLLRAREALSLVIDDGSTVRNLDTGLESVSAYYFVSEGGWALTVVNVGNREERLRIELPGRSGAEILVDARTGERVAIRDGRGETACPAHGLRMFRDATE